VTRHLTLLVLAAAALLEVLGDALIRKGLRGSGALLVGGGVLALGAYGVAVNLLSLDFSRTLGSYIGVFAVTSVAVGRFVFGDEVPAATWAGLSVVLLGSLIIQWDR
jgi:drug/metabolite transporter superfamily protein YnfA